MPDVTNRFLVVSCLCDVTYLYMWSDSSIYASCLIHICVCVMFLSHKCDVPISHVVTGLTHMSDEAHLYMWRDSIISVIWFLLICDVTHSYLWRDSFLLVISCVLLQEGKAPYDALSCRSFPAKEPLIIGLFGGKWTIKIKHPMGLHHSVRNLTQSFVSRDSCMYVMWLIHACDLTHSYDPTHRSEMVCVRC